MLPEGVEHFHVQAGAVRLHCAAMGPADGPLVLLLHGFPECWATWRGQLPALAEAGFRAVAPDLRGYGGSDKPRGVEQYRIEKLAQDVADLVAALGRERADLVGHDWGGAVAWRVAMWHPARVRKLAILNSPHPADLSRAMRTLRQIRKSWYMFLFQLPFLPERLITPGRLQFIFRRTTARKGAYEQAEIAANIDAMREPEGPLNYYRAALRFGGTSHAAPFGLRPSPAKPAPPRWEPVQAETLVIWGERDRWLGSELAVPDARWVPRARVERIADASHFVQADAPDEVSRLLVEFLR
ncbi:MAG TPA: alpha/beta hydrolase [Myxococcales bacterium]|nr:alpha/beta hydrolase [Myxococcales bacterium]HET9753874.1 alpha/beta hydrolase [Myxococcales bacterium]